MIAALGVAEPGVLAGFAMLAAPEVDESDFRQLGEAPAGLEAVVWGVHAGGTRGLVARQASQAAAVFQNSGSEGPAAGT